MEKLLVTRPDSLIGANAGIVLADRMDVIVPEGRAASSSPSDATQHMIEAVMCHRPGLVIHAGPTSWSSWDAAGIDGTRVDVRCQAAAEAALIAQLTAACQAAGAKLIVAATDAVFCGPRMFHGEDAQAWASTPYARTARTVEQAARAAGALVLRGHVYGWMPRGGAANYAERMFHALTAELPCRVDARRNASPILASDFVRLAYEAHRANLVGLYNLTGAERTTPHRFAAELAAALGVPGCNVRFDDAVGDRRKYLEETSLDVGAIRRRLERPLPMLREGLARFVDEAFNGYRERWDAGIADVVAPVLEAQAA